MKLTQDLDAVTMIALDGLSVMFAIGILVWTRMLMVRDKAGSIFLWSDLRRAVLADLV